MRAWHRVALAALLTLGVACAALFPVEHAGACNPRVATCRALLASKPAASVVVVPIAPNKVTSSTLDEWFVAGSGCLNGSSTTCANGDTVATLADQSGNGHTATKCPAGPVYTANVVNGLPALTFTKANSQCLTTSYTGTAKTIIVVYFSSTTNFQENTGSLNDDIISGAPQAGATITAYDIYIDTPLVADGGVTNPFHVSKFSYGTTANSSNYSWQTLPERHRSVWQISGMTNDGTTLTAYNYGAVVGTATIPGGATPYTATGQVIGSGDFGGTHGSFFQGNIAEIIVYPVKISSSDYAGVILYEQQKYGLVPSGNYLLVAGNSNNGQYNDSNLYMLQGTDGISYPYVLPTNFVPSVYAGQNRTASTAPQILHDMSGNLVKYNGRFWASDSQCPVFGTPTANGIINPCTFVSVLTSLPDPTSGLPVNWSLAGTLNCDIVLDGVSSTRGCFNDGWVIDAADNSVHYLFNASNNEQTFAAVKEYQVPITLNANGTFATGAVAAITGSAFPVGAGGTPNSGYFTESIIKLGSTYYAFLSNLSAGFVLQWTTSAAPFSGYNGTLTGVTVGGSAPGPQPQWPSWIQTGGGNGKLYIDTSDANYANGVASDNAFGTVSGLATGPTMSFAGTFHAQQGSFALLPVVSLP